MIIVDEETGEIIAERLKDQLVPVPEEIVAFHDRVAVKGWTDSSGRGPSIRVSLPSRDTLAIFETITKRSGKRAGQRYKAAWQPTEDAEAPPILTDLWFAGANWAHQDGASVKFSVGPDDFECFRQGDIQIGVEEPVEYWLTLVQVDEDEKPIDQEKAAKLEEPKGGPHSKRVAMLTQDKDFQRYVAFRTGFKIKAVDAATADQWIKGYCEVQSKKDFDHNPGAWDMFQVRIMSPYLRWSEGGGRFDEEEETDGSDS